MYMFVCGASLQRTERQGQATLYLYMELQKWVSKRGNKVLAWTRGMRKMGCQSSSFYAAPVTQVSHDNPLLPKEFGTRRDWIVIQVSLCVSPDMGLARAVLPVRAAQGRAATLTNGGMGMLAHSTLALVRSHTVTAHPSGFPQSWHSVPFRHNDMG